MTSAADNCSHTRQRLQNRCWVCLRCHSVKKKDGWLRPDPPMSIYIAIGKPGKK